MPETTTKITSLSASQIAELVRSRQLSPVEVVEAHLARIAKLNSRINAFVQLDGNSALKQARNAEAAVMHNEQLGPVHGVPISIKSLISVAGMKWEAGTKLRAGTTAKKDAPLVQRLRNAGAIVLGTIASGSPCSEYPARLWPLTQSAAGLPIGVQITARPWEEELVLSIAQVIEEQCAWRKQPPL